MLSIDFVKGVISFDDKPKVLNYVIKRIMYAVVIFLIPSTVSGIFSILGVNIKDSDDCWKYAGEVNVETVKSLSKLQQEALEKQTIEAQQELNSKAAQRANAISYSQSSMKLSSSNSSTGGSKSCSKKLPIRLTAFKGSSLRNSVKNSNVGTINGNWKTYKYKGKKYIVIATAMKSTKKYKNSISAYNFSDYDILTLQIEGKKYDAIVLDVCGACAKSTEILKIDLWTTNDKQTWKDKQYLCNG